MCRNNDLVAQNNDLVAQNNDNYCDNTQNNKQVYEKKLNVSKKKDFEYLNSDKCKVITYFHYK